MDNSSQMKTPVTTIDFLRHGQCEGGDIFRGTTDVELTEDGWSSMQAIVDTQAAINNWDHIITSPLLRCRLFAEQLKERYKLSLNVEQNFCEMNFGDWEGQELSTIWKREKETADLIYSAPDTFQAPNGEAMTVFAERVIAGLEKNLPLHKGKNLLLIQHGGTIRVLLSHLLSIPLSSMTRLYIPYACFSRVKIHHTDSLDRISLIFHNGTAD